MGNACSCCPRSSSTNQENVATMPSSTKEENVITLPSSTNQENDIALPPSTSEENIEITLPQVKDVSHLDEVISFIEERLNAIVINKAEERTSEAEVTSWAGGGVSSTIKYGSYLLENVLKRVKKHASKMLNSDTRKVVIDILKEAAQIHWVAAGLGVVAYLLDQIDKVSANRSECVEFLRYMCALAKQIKELINHLPQEKLSDVVVFIVQGSFFCISRMQSSNLSSFFYAAVNAEELKSLQTQLAHTYPDLTLDVVIRILNLMPIRLPPSQGEDPDAVGINESRSDVIELLQMKDVSTRAVVVYGIGGIGKTTLATCVFSSLNLDAYKHCAIIIDQNCSDTDLKLLQEQILFDLFSKRYELRNCVEGQRELVKAFKEAASQPVFLFIDNALRESDLAKLLPRDLSSCLPKRSKMLVTTRNLKETAMLDQEDIILQGYSVNSLPDKDAKKLLCKKALGSPEATFDESLDIDSLVSICGGIPLVLEIVGSKLHRCRNNLSACSSIIESLQESLVKGQRSELTERVVDVVYSSLPSESYKETFLDIAAFFSNWERHRVSNIVGEAGLVELEDAALIKTSQGRVKLHDVVLARGKYLSKSDRITDLESLKEVLQHPEKLEKLKGIWLGWVREFELEAKHLDKMHQSLRVLYLGYGTKTTGLCVKVFENLKFLNSIHGSCSAMKLNKLPRLRDFEGRISHDDSFCQLPDCLRRLVVRDLELDRLPGSFGNLSHLEELNLQDNCYVTNFPESFGQLKSLRKLKLECFKELTSLPKSFGNLTSLEELSLRFCDQFESLPATFVQLKYLSSLTLVGCGYLTKLPESFENFSLLKSLKICECHRLESLPANLGHLRFLEELSLDNCEMLTTLPQSFGQLSNLKKLSISSDGRLCSLPQNFGQLKSLKYLNMNGCKSLETLSDDFGFLSSVVAIKASACSMLDGKEMDKLMEVKRLMALEIAESPTLIERWEEIKERHPFLVSTQFYMLLSVRDRAYHRMDMYRHSVSTAIFHGESRFLSIDGQLAEWSSAFPVEEEKVVFLLTMRDLCSSSNQEALKMVTEKIGEVASEGFHIMYVGLIEQSLEHIGQTLRHLSDGTGALVRAWITPHEKWKQLFGFSACSILSPKYDSQVSPQLVNSVNTLIARASISIDGKGKRKVQNLELILPIGSEEKALRDPRGGFTTLFSDLADIQQYLV